MLPQKLDWCCANACFSKVGFTVSNLSARFRSRKTLSRAACTLSMSGKDSDPCKKIRAWVRKIGKGSDLKSKIIPTSLTYWYTCKGKASYNDNLQPPDAETCIYSRDVGNDDKRSSRYNKLTSKAFWFTIGPKNRSMPFTKLGKLQRTWTMTFM